ncbi:MAG: peptidase family protein [Cyanobacteria bacterium RYN_339]|nr:peptidase family protein [Cyanobacteria bacterium RYN_339]
MRHALLAAPLALLLALPCRGPAAAAAVNAPGTGEMTPAAATKPQPIANPVEMLTLGSTGVPVYGMQDGRLPRVWYHLYLEAGERVVPAKLAGLVSAAAELFDRGPAGVPVTDFRRDLFRRGTEIRWEAGNHYLVAHVKCLPAELPAATAMVARIAHQPKLDDESFKQTMATVINQRTALDDSMRDITFIYAKQKLWDFRPEARQPEGWVESLKAIKKSDLQAYVTQRLAHPAAFIATAAPIPISQVARSLAPTLRGWIKPLVPRRTPMPAMVAARRVILIDKPGATDNQIYALSPLPLDLRSSEAAAAEVFMAGMGFDLGSRLGKTLRVQRGLTYGANSGVRRVEWPQWYAYSFGGITQTPKIVAGLFELFDGAKDGLTPAEVETAKRELIQGYAADMESPAQQLDAVANAVAQGLPAAYPFQRPGLIAAVTPEQVKQTGRLAAGLAHATIVVMGDASKIKESVAAALPKGTALVVKTMAELGPEAMTPASP